jgi:hypothetical protein
MKEDRVEAGVEGQAGDEKEDVKQGDDGRTVLSDLRTLASAILDRQPNSEEGSQEEENRGGVDDADMGSGSESDSTQSVSSYGSRHLELQRRLAAVHRNISATILRTQVSQLVPERESKISSHFIRSPHLRFVSHPAAIPLPLPTSPWC